MIDVSDLAKYLLYLNRREAELTGDEAESDMTPMKLQKLLYYCQGYALALTGGPLFAEPIVAWRYGPVVKSVYDEYKAYKGACLPFELAAELPSIDECAKSIAGLVMRDKAKYSALELVRMTHGEKAWREAWEEEESESSPFPNVPLSLATMAGDFSTEIVEEMSPEKEDRLWTSVGRELTASEWEALAPSV